MTNKRKSADFFEPLMNNKRSRVSDAGHSSPHGAAIQPRVDPTYGQRGAFPGLDDLDGERDVFYGPASDGLDYLRMVRSEAKTVPNLLVAPTSPISGDAKLYADYPQGYYADGAYTAVPAPPLCPTTDNETEDVDPQEAYYTVLHKRFSRLTATLHSPSPTAVVTPAQSFLPTAHGTWRSKILYSQPTMALLSQFQQETVMRALSILETLLTTKNLAKGKELGAWAWGLLARCRPVGEMGSEEVGILRSLGKKAVWVLRGMMAGREEEAMVGEEGDVDMEVELEGESIAEPEGTKPNEGHEPFYEEEEDREGNEPLPYTQDRVEVSESTMADPPCEAIPTSSTGPFETLPVLSEPAETPSDDPLLQARHRLLSSLPPPSSSTITSATLKDGATSDMTRNDLPPPADPAEGEPSMATEDESTVIEKGEEKFFEMGIHATLDMIVTVVGEFYGQRDLLDGRALWDEM